MAFFNMIETYFKKNIVKKIKAYNLFSYFFFLMIGNSIFNYGWTNKIDKDHITLSVCVLWENNIWYKTYSEKQNAKLYVPYVMMEAFICVVLERHIKEP